jgi:hypothetical protein
MKVSVLGIDLGKNVCSIIGLDASGQSHGWMPVRRVHLSVAAFRSKLRVRLFIYGTCRTWRVEFLRS